MSVVVNARTAGGRWLSFEVRGGRFRGVRVADAPEAAPDARPLASLTDASADGVYDAGGLMVLPAGVDVHVHSRDPGLTHKETWGTLAAGAWRGGVTAVCDMPNTLPPTMTRDEVLRKAEIAAASGLRFALQLGVGAGNINQVAALLSDPSLPLCSLKVFYGKSTGELMYDDLETLRKSLPRNGTKPIVFHSEDQCTVDCNHAKLKDKLHARDNAAFKVHSAIRSSEAAHASTRIILAWAADYGRPVHIAHVSTPLEVELVAEAKAKGLPVTCEVAPHHLLFSTDDYERLGPLVKMNPPLRSQAEVDQLVKLFGQGAIDVWATDHAPHTLEEKRREVEKSPSGVPAVELYYQLLFEMCARTGLSLEKGVRMAAETPARLFGFDGLGRIEDGAEADFTAIERRARVVRDQDVVSKCGWTPYDGMTLQADVLATWCRGKRMHPANGTGG